MAATFGARLRDVVSQAGRIFDRAPPRKPRYSGEPEGQVVNDLPLYLQFQRIGGSLTPAQLTDIIRQADNGYMYRIVDLTNEMRQKDLHLQSILETHETDLAGLPWQIEPPEGATAVERKATDFCQKVLGALDEVPNLLGHLAGGFLDGHGVAETLVEKDGGYVVPVGFTLVHPRRFCHELSVGRLMWWDQAGGLYPYPGVDFMATWPGKFISFTPRVVGDVQHREGLARPLLWAALFRNWDVRDWLSLAELAWKPWRVGSYAKSANDEDINNLKAVLRSMSASGIAVVPNETKIEVTWPENIGPSGSPHSELFDVFGREMSKAVLGTTTTMELGKRGNQTASKTGERMASKKLESRSRKMAGALRAHLLTPMVRMNFGDGVRVPMWTFNTEDEVDLLSYGQGINQLVTSGMTSIPASHVHKKTGIPLPVDFTDYTLQSASQVTGDAGDKDPSDSSGSPGAADKKPDAKPKPSDDGGDEGGGD